MKADERINEVPLVPDLLCGATALEPRPASKGLTLEIAAIYPASWHGALPGLQTPCVLSDTQDSHRAVPLARRPSPVPVGQIPSVI